MPQATAAELAQADKAIAEVRRQFAAAAPKVAAQAERWLASDTDKQVAGAFAQVGAVLERWAKVHRLALERGRFDDGKAQTLQGFLDFGRVELADAIKQVSAEAYDRSLFAAVAATVKETAATVANPALWPPWLKWGAAAVVGVVVLVAVAAVARR